MFVIYSLMRSGTHMLQTALDSHSEIKCYFGMPKLPGFKDVGVVALMQACQQHDKLIGFTMHGIRPEPSSLVRIASTQFVQEAVPFDTKFIILHRRNLLARYVSHQIAVATGEWDPLTEVTHVPKVQVDPTQAATDIEMSRIMLAAMRWQYPGALDIAYEDMCSDFAGTLARVQEYLGVEHEDLAPKTYKAGRPLQECVENYVELQRYFTNRADYDTFFVEPPSEYRKRRRNRVMSKANGRRTRKRIKVRRRRRSK